MLFGVIESLVDEEAYSSRTFFVSCCVAEVESAIGGMMGCRVERVHPWFLDGQDVVLL